MNRMYPYFGCNFMSIVEHFHCWLHQIPVPQVGSKLHDYIEEINMLYPPEIVQCPGKSPTTALPNMVVGSRKWLWNMVHMNSCRFDGRWENPKINLLN